MRNPEGKFLPGGSSYRHTARLYNQLLNHISSISVATVRGHVSDVSYVKIPWNSVKKTGI